MTVGKRILAGLGYGKWRRDFYELSKINCGATQVLVKTRVQWRHK